MIRVYTGGADRDRDRFLFDCILDRLPADTVLLVPDQYTLEAERKAFDYMNADTLLELEIMSRSGFTRMVEAQTGKPAGLAVNKYGRHMLLTKLMLDMEKDADEAAKSRGKAGESENSGNSGNPGDSGGSETVKNGNIPGIFSGIRKKRAFISMLNDQISELKQYNISPEELGEMARGVGDDDILRAKLDEISLYYEKYQTMIQGHYTDTEDYLQAVIDKISQAPFVEGKIFWIDGFDYMTPKLLSLVEAVAGRAGEVNIILYGQPQDGPEADGPAGRIIREADPGFFSLSEDMKRRLKEAGERTGGYREEMIPEKYAVRPAPELRLITASDFYSEAETIAADIRTLVREKGFRYRDILVICNEAEKRGSIFRRTFQRYEIPLFMDRKRSITQEPAISFILTMLEIIRNKRRFDDTFRMLKTGFGPLDDNAVEELEKYCRKYSIKSGRWKKPFVYGMKDEGTERMELLNAAREKVDGFISSAEGLFKGKTTVRERCRALYIFLTETALMPQRCIRSARSLEARGLLEEAETLSQIWETVTDVLDQLVEVLGDEAISHEDFNEILSEGFEEVEIGLLPTNNDQVVLGTMQRTRSGNVKALFTAGANEGVLPENGRTESLLSDDEKQLLTEHFRRVSKTDELRIMEQNLAIYRNLTRDCQYLTISCAEMDSDASPLRRCEIMEDLLAEGDKGRVTLTACRDHRSEGNFGALLQSEAGACGHVAAALRRSMEGEKLDDVWKAAALVLDGSRGFEAARRGLLYGGVDSRIDRKQVRELFSRGADGNIILSTSAVEKYSRCPFDFFISYGLKPDEERSFRVDLRSIGDIYHECLRRVAQELSADGLEINGEDSLWQTVSEEECREMTGRYVEEFAGNYREGILEMEGREAYIRERIKDICSQTAWLMIQQVRSGRIKAIYFEQRFGIRSDAAFPPVVIDPHGENELFIEGVIDRIDVIRGTELLAGTEGDDGPPAAGDDNREAPEGAPAAAGESSRADGGPGPDPVSLSGLPEEKDFIRIIDYKSGSEKFSLSEVENGWRLQLMIYLKGAMGAIENSRPAGVFYFAVREPRIDVSMVDPSEEEEKVRGDLLKSARLDGALVDNKSVIQAMDSEMEGWSDVLPVQKKKDGTYTGNSLLDGSDFDRLIQTTDNNLAAIAARLVSGCMDPDPKASAAGNKPCEYCSYSSICGYGKQTDFKEEEGK